MKLGFVSCVSSINYPLPRGKAPDAEEHALQWSPTQNLMELMELSTIELSCTQWPSGAIMTCCKLKIVKAFTKNIRHSLTHNHDSLFFFVCRQITQIASEHRNTWALLASFDCRFTELAKHNSSSSTPLRQIALKLSNQIWTFHTPLLRVLSTRQAQIGHARLYKLSGVMWCAKDCQRMQNGGLGWIRTAWVPSCLDDLDAGVKITHESVFMTWTARNCCELFYINLYRRLPHIL